MRIEVEKVTIGLHSHTGAGKSIITICDCSSVYMFVGIDFFIVLFQYP